MIKFFLTITAAILLSACSSEVIIKPAPVISHTRVNKSLDDCDRLGQVKVEYETDVDYSPRESQLHVQELLKQQAYDEYRANNIVIIQARYTKGEYRQKNMVSGRAIAYMCYDSEDKL